MSAPAIQLVTTEEIEPAIGGGVVYAVLLDDRRVGWIGDERPWRGHRYGGRRWWACWREEGDTAARWNSFDGAMLRTRKAALAALVEQMGAA